MSKNLELKKQVVSDIVKKFQDAQSVIVVKLQRPDRGAGDRAARPVPRQRR